jgi:hypothetical protein
MTLTEFLLTANADDNIALAEWQAIPTTETIYMVTSTMNALLAQNKLKIPFKKAAADSAHPFQDYADVFVDATRQPTDFNFNPSSTMGAGVVSMLNEMAVGPFVVDGFDYSTVIGQLRDLLVILGSKVVYRNAGATIEQVKAIRYPPVWSPCDHGDNLYTLSKSNFDVVVLSVLLAESISNVFIRCYWSTSVGAQEVLSTSALTIRGTDAISLSRGFTRPELGVPATAKVLRFEYTSVYDGVVTSVSVSK